MGSSCSVARCLGLAGLIFVVTILFTALLGDSLAPQNPLELSIRDKFLPPSFAHPFGTDFLGRDVFSRVISGSRIAMTAAVVAVSLSAGIGLVLGMLAGMGPRWLDYSLLLLFGTRCVHFRW